MAGTNGERETISEQGAIDLGDKSTEPGDERNFGMLVRTLEPPNGRETHMRHSAPARNRTHPP
jgi:hypothetical protein